MVRRRVGFIVPVVGSLVPVVGSPVPVVPWAVAIAGEGERQADVSLPAVVGGRGAAQAWGQEGNTSRSRLGVVGRTGARAKQEQGQKQEK